MPASNPTTVKLRKDKVFLHNDKEYPVSHSTPFDVCDRYHDLIVEKGFRDVLEIGTLYGQSTLHLAEAVSKTGGNVTSIDLRLEKRQWMNGEEIVDVHLVAERLIAEAGLGKYVNLLSGNSNEILPQLLQDNRRFDFILIDGSHVFSIALIDFINADRLLRSNGVIALDDVGGGPARRANLDGGPNRVLSVAFSSGHYRATMLNANVALLEPQR